jgi:hypothetical protein
VIDLLPVTRQLRYWLESPSDPADLRVGRSTSWEISWSAERVPPYWFEGLRIDLRGPLSWRSGSGRYAQNGGVGNRAPCTTLDCPFSPLTVWVVHCPIRAACWLFSLCHISPCIW